MGKLAEVKTTENAASVQDFMNSVAEEQKKKDGLQILEWMQKATNEKPKMWGSSIIGFGKRRIKSASGREVEWFTMGFSPRKANLTLYVGLSVAVHQTLLKKLGKHKTGVGCLYINKLADVDVKVLQEIIKATVKENK